MAEIQLQRRSSLIPAIISDSRLLAASCFLLRSCSRNLGIEHSRAAWNSLRERLNKSPPKDNDDILENHISDQQETLEVKVTAPILARLHFLTINVFGSCQNWDQSGCRLPDKERRSKLGTILRPSNFRPKKEERNECRRKWVKSSPSFRLPSYSCESFFPQSRSHPFSKRKESLEKLFRHANVEGQHPNHPLYPIFEDYPQLKILI